MCRFRMILILSVIAAGMLLSDEAIAEPIRSGKGWAIHAQREPEDWTKLVAGGNLIAKKLVRTEAAPNDHNTGSELLHLTDGVLAGAEGRMWSDKRAMGWAYQPYVRLKFDLGKSERVGQVVMRLQVISKDSTLPGTITDGTPLTNFKCSHEKLKVCGMGLNGEQAVLVSNYQGVPRGTSVTIQSSAASGTPVWDLHTNRQVGTTQPDGSFNVVLDEFAAHLYYLGKKHASAISP